MRRWVLAGLVLWLMVGTVSAQNPRGMYFMQNTQNGVPTTFTEWFSVFNLGNGQYELRDFFGYGWDASISNGQILVSGQFPGSFMGPDMFSTQVGNGPGYLYVCTRCPETAINFPVRLTGPTMAGDPARAGDYDSVREGLHPQSGALLSTLNETVVLSVTADRLRLTMSNGVFFEGVFISQNRVAIRYIANSVTGWIPSYASYPGTLSNHSRDSVGVVTFPDADSYDAIICLQTRDAIGAQSQSLVKITGTRAGGGQIPGDYNSDGSVNLVDAVGLLQHLFNVSGALPLPCDSGAVGTGNNLTVLDGNGDGSVDIVDAVYLLGYLFNSGPAHVGGTQCVPIMGCSPMCP